MRKHAIKIKGFDTLKDAAHEIGRMRYDALSEFLWHLMEEMENQQDKDIKVGKKQLAKDTTLLIHSLMHSSDAAGRLFDRYKKYMKEELE